MLESILSTIKKLLGIDEAIDDFDIDIIACINVSFSVLNQLGVGPETAYSISGSNNTWDEFTSDESMLSLVKMYVHIKTKLMFDPPASSILSACYEKQLDELGWRLQAEYDKTDTPIA